MKKKFAFFTSERSSSSFDEFSSVTHTHQPCDMFRSGTRNQLTNIIKHQTKQLTWWLSFHKKNLNNQCLKIVFYCHYKCFTFIKKRKKKKKEKKCK